MPAKDQLPEGWREASDRLRCRYEFKDFVRAMAFLTEVAFAAEAAEHHPDFTVHWNRVDFLVWTHDAGGVTARDHKLAAAIASIAKRHAGKLASA